MGINIGEDLYVRLWAIAFAIAAGSGDVATLIFTQYPNSPTAKLVSTILACVGIVTTLALAQSKRAIETDRK